MGIAGILASIGDWRVDLTSMTRRLKTAAVALYLPCFAFLIWYLGFRIYSDHSESPNRTLYRLTVGALIVSCLAVVGLRVLRKEWRSTAEICTSIAVLLGSVVGGAVLATILGI